MSIRGVGNHRGSWNQSSVGTEGHLSLGVVKNYPQILDCAKGWSPQTPHCSNVNAMFWEYNDHSNPGFTLLSEAANRNSG